MLNVMNEPKITIGMPVYNGEKLIKKSLDSLLAQTLTNFELLISDNASKDSTAMICKKYAKNDFRIKFFQQSENRGATWNFNFVLHKANSKYFMWASHDDFWEKDYLEKNIKAIENDSTFVGSCGTVKLYSLDQNEEDIDSKFLNFKKNIISTLRPGKSCDLKGNFEKKVKLLFKNSAYRLFYGVFRTDVLKKSIVSKSFVGPDVAWLINILKHGDINLENDTVMYKSYGGISTKGSLEIARKFNHGFLELIFPHYPLTKWCFKHLGTRIFFQNFGHFIKLNVGSEFLVLLDMINSLIKKPLKRKIIFGKKVFF